MTDSADTQQPKPKGRPQAPFKIERLAIATYQVNQGMTFKAAAEQGVRFFRYDFDTASYVPDDEANLRLPQTPAGRRTALYKIRDEQLKLAGSLPTKLFEKDGGPNLVPTAYRFHEPPKRGAPKKR